MARSHHRHPWLASRMRRVFRTLALCFGLVTAAMALTGATALAQSDPSTPDQQLLDRGRDVYGRACATCHGENGLGQDEAPAITDAGPATVDFYVRTGRMPLLRMDEPVRHREQRLTELERQALVAYVPTLGDDDGGAPIPDVSGWEDADLARGLELFTSNCAACHGPTAAGIAVGQKDVSSNLEVATPLEIAEAIRVGPGVMPVFGEDVVDQHDLDAIVAWVMDLRQREAPGGAQIGRSGPVSEGFIAWIVGMGLLTAVMYLLGERAKDVDDA